MVIDYKPVFLFWAGDANDPNQMPLYDAPELRNVKYITRSKTLELNFTPKKSV